MHIKFDVAARAIQVRALMSPVSRMGVLAVAAPAVRDGEVNCPGNYVWVVRNQEIHVAVKALTGAVVIEFRESETFHEQSRDAGLCPDFQKRTQLGADQGVPCALIQEVGAQGFP